MADNFISYSRFTALPPNISDYGATVEELQLQRGKPDANPALSPMAAPRIPAQRLFLKPRGSDQLRLGEPVEPDVDPYEGPRSVLTLTRSALRKLDSSVVAELQKLVQSGAIRDANLAALMGDSFRRVVGLREYLVQLYEMTEAIYVRSIAAGRG